MAVKKRSVWMLLLFLAVGILAGTLIGNLLAHFTGWELFTYSYEIGTSTTPAWINLSVIKICFGISVKINLGTLIGIIFGLLLYFRD